VKTGEFKVRWLGGQAHAPQSARLFNYDFDSYWRFHIKRWTPFSLNICLTCSRLHFTLRSRPVDKQKDRHRGAENRNLQCPEAVG
jgi:hypothetical protein